MLRLSVWVSSHPLSHQRERERERIPLLPLARTHVILGENLVNFRLPLVRPWTKSYTISGKIHEMNGHSSEICHNPQSSGQISQDLWPNHMTPGKKSQQNLIDEGTPWPQLLCSLLGHFGTFLGWGYLETPDTVEISPDLMWCGSNNRRRNEWTSMCLICTTLEVINAGGW